MPRRTDSAGPSSSRHRWERRAPRPPRAEPPRAPSPSVSRPLPVSLLSPPLASGGGSGLRALRARAAGPTHRWTALAESCPSMFRCPCLGRSRAPLTARRETDETSSRRAGHGGPPPAPRRGRDGHGGNGPGTARRPGSRQRPVRRVHRWDSAAGTKQTRTARSVFSARARQARSHSRTRLPRTPTAGNVNGTSQTAGQGQGGSGTQVVGQSATNEQDALSLALTLQKGAVEREHARLSVERPAKARPRNTGTTSQTRVMPLRHPRPASRSRTPRPRTRPQGTRTGPSSRLTRPAPVPVARSSASRPTHSRMRRLSPQPSRRIRRTQTLPSGS